MLEPNRNHAIAAILVAAIYCAQVELRGDELTPVDLRDNRPATDATALVEPVDIAQSYTSAAEHFRGKRWAAAAAEYRRLLAADAQHALADPARFYLAESLLHAGKYDDAAEAWLAYLATDHDSNLAPAARYRAGECCYLAGRRDDAARELKRLIADHPEAPTLPRALLYLGNLAAAAGDFAAAAKYFGRIAEEFPNEEVFPQALLGHAQALLRNGEVRAAWNIVGGPYHTEGDDLYAADVAWIAAETLDRLGRDADALTAAKRFLVVCDADDPRRIDALLLSARLLERLKRLDSAAAAYRTLLREYNGQPRCDVALYELAWLLRQLAHEPEAVEAFSTLAADYPQSMFRADALYRLAEHDLEHGRAADAAAKLQVADKQATDDIRPHVLLLQVRTALALQQPAAAETALAELAEKYPRHDLSRQVGFWKAELLFQTEQWDKASGAFARLLQATDEAQPETWHDSARLRHVQALSEAGRWVDVLEAVAAAKRESAVGYEYDYLAGRAHTARAELQDARAAYERVVADPRARGSEAAATAQFLAAETYFHQRNYEAALREYRRCATEHKQPTWQAAALLQAGKCQEHLGRWSEARLCYDELITSHAASPYVADAQTRRDAVVRQAEAAATDVQRK